MASRLVGVMGKKRHGKDTFAARLTSSHGFTRLAFADPIREALLALDPWVRVEQDEVGPLAAAGFQTRVDLLYRLRVLVDRAGWDAVKATREGRRLLQDFGVGLRDHADPDLWVRRTLTEARDLDGPVVITDVRFPNEVANVRALGGLLVWVNNPRVPDSGDTHASEVSVSAKDADLTVDNSGSIGDLYRIADSVVRR